MQKKYYQKIDLIRVISCISILLYHLGILKGGYLAVCTFFVLTGYLSIVSKMNKENFSLKEYYISRLKRIYLPLIVVVFISISVISFFPNINFLNLKPETTSVLLGYNNYWQLNANLDYFVRHISSPFMHLWYISIILQFELIFPLIYIIIKKLNKKLNSFITSSILIGLAILSYILFLKKVNSDSIMIAYYGTISRSFSILFGLALGVIHASNKNLIIKNKLIGKTVFSIYIILLLIIFSLVDANSKYFSISMILTTLISMRLIDYSKIFKDINSPFQKLISSLSKVSYEIFLVQYPVIFIFQNINMNGFIKTPLIIIIVLIVSYIINKAINIKKNTKLKLFKILLTVIVFFFTIFGIYKYIITKDHTAEMKKLESDLNNNRELIEKKQKEFEEKMKQEQDEWENILNNLDNDAEKLKEKVRNLHIVGIGDSIMELAVKDLYKEFPNGYFDAMTNRTEKGAIDIINELRKKNMLADIVVLNIGTNGDCSVKAKERVMDTVKDKKVFWLSTSNADCPTFNTDLNKAKENYDNVYIIDWGTYAKEHPEYLISDKVHPNVKGCKIYAEFIYNAIYEHYLKEFNENKEKLIEEHEKNNQTRMTFIGNDLLLGLFDYLKDDYNDSEFIIDKNFKFDTLKDKLEDKIKNKQLAHNIVFTFDKNLNLSNSEYEQLIDICKDYNIYIITNNNLKIDAKNTNIINYNSTFKNNKNYFSYDGIHLTKDGNMALKELIDTTLKNK